MAKTGRVRRYPLPTRRHPPHHPIPVPARRGPWYCMPSCLVGMAAIALILACSFVLPEVRRCDPLAMDLDARLQGPSPTHWLGADQFGRDVACRVLYGGRISLPIGVLAVTMSLLPGLCLGLVAGYYDRWVDVAVGRLADMMLGAEKLFPAFYDTIY